MISPSLLEILCCPETHQRVRTADTEMIARLNQQISAGTLKNRAEKPVTAAFDGGLVREDGKFLYPIRNGIPVMLVAEAIPLS